MLGSETPHRVSNSKQKSAAGDPDTPPTGKKRSHGVAAKEQDEDETNSEVGGERPHKRRLHDILRVSTGFPNGVSLHGDMHSLPIVSPGSQRYDFRPTTMYVFQPETFSCWDENAHLEATSHAISEMGFWKLYAKSGRCCDLIPKCS
jgi:hypothetical protein